MPDLQAQLCEILPLSTEDIAVLFATGLLNDKTVLRYIVKHEYFARLKKRTNGTSCFDIKIDLAVEYNVSRSFVDKVLYHYVNLRV